jgi:glyoxylate reductase
MKRRVLVTRPMPQAPQEILRKGGAEIHFLHGPRGELPGARELLEGIRHADVLFARGVRVTRRLMKANPGLRGIANFGAGYDNIDITSATELGIPVTNTAGPTTEATADLAWALLMATARKIPQAHQYVMSGNWKGMAEPALMGQDVGPGASNRPKVLGIIGFGKIGRAVMRRSNGFKMKVLVYDPFVKAEVEKMKGVKYKELHDLLRESDFITLHCLLTPETHHLIGAREFGLMKPTAILINASRGPVVEERALVSALENRKIAGAGLDVYERQPRLPPGLKRLDNVVLLPHMGVHTADTRDQMAVLTAKNAVAMLNGRRPPNLVNPEVIGSAEYLSRLPFKKVQLD